MTSVSGPSGCRVKNTRNMHVSCNVQLHMQCAVPVISPISLFCGQVSIGNAGGCANDRLKKHVSSSKAPPPRRKKKQQSAVGDAVVSQTPHKR